MFGIAEAAIAMKHYADIHRAQEQAEREAIEALPVEMQAAAWEAKRVRDEKRRVEAIAERRHQEMVSAVRYGSSGSTAGGFGIGFILGLGIGS
ncbi:hypothetical protein ABIE51_001454 [Lysobacter sp. OAE881]|uniref:hypothetical protein n=1 Tax=Lysobacter sp. OAE881 TaxID=2663813 RepID=UPI0017895143